MKHLGFLGEIWAVSLFSPCNEVIRSLLTRFHLENNMRYLLALIVVLLLRQNAIATTEKRVALVIGNSEYANSPLKNPVNDAKDIATKLRKLGFEVIERNNLKTKQIGGTLREFRNKLTPGAVALVFYAGHGLQIKGDNYLPAVDADINSEEDVPNQSIAMRQIMDVLDESKSRLNLVFLDACRNNPYARSFRSSDRGLARVNAPSGTLISYATKPGSVAADGTGRNGLYTSKLLAQLDSNLQIELALKRVVTEVKTSSKGKQEPWMEGSLEGDFCFGGCGVNTNLGAQVAKIEPVSLATRIKSREEIEQDGWENARSSGNIDAIQEYLMQYPKGRFVGQAKILIATLKTAPIKPAEAISSSTHEDEEISLWNEIQKGNKRDDYEAYLAQYPKGKYAVLAKSRIKTLPGTGAIAGPISFLDGDWKCSVGAAKFTYTVHYTVRGNQVEASASTKFSSIYTAEIVGGALVLSGRSTSNPEFGEITETYKILSNSSLHGYLNRFKGIENKVNTDCNKTNKTISASEERNGLVSSEAAAGQFKLRTYP